MPITVVPPFGQVSVPIGPGTFLTASSDFIGPLPTGTQWLISLSSDSEGQHTLATIAADANSKQISFQIGLPIEGKDWAWPGFTGIAVGQPCFVQVVLEEPGSVAIDSGTQQFPWDVGAAGEAYQVGQGGGFTAGDRASLNLVVGATALVDFITALTLQDMGTAPPGGSLAAQLDTWRFGIIVRLTQIPAELKPQTPDLDYWVPTLAVVRVFRGTDILSRIPIHRSSQIIPFGGNGMVLSWHTADVDIWAPGMSVEVDFLPGVAGQAFLMNTP